MAAPGAWEGTMKAMLSISLLLLAILLASVGAVEAQQNKTKPAKPFDFQKCYQGMIARGQPPRDASRFCSYQQRRESQKS
jgi:hypothetical protein